MSKDKPTKEELDGMFQKIGNMKLKSRMGANKAFRQLIKDQESSFMKQIKRYQEQTGKVYEFPKL